MTSTRFPWISCVLIRGGRSSTLLRKLAQCSDLNDVFLVFFFNEKPSSALLSPPALSEDQAAAAEPGLESLDGSERFGGRSGLEKSGYQREVFLCFFVVFFYQPVDLFSTTAQRM